MSEVILKMMRSAGGISPSLLGCDAIWTPLATACARWASASLGLQLVGEVAGKTPLANTETEEQIREQFGYICLPCEAGGLRAISISRPLAQQYVAKRLKEPVEAIETSPPLFLRLMCDKPARALWSDIREALPIGPVLPKDFTVVDPAGMPGALDDAGRMLRIHVALRDKADSEGLSDPFWLSIYFELDALEAYAAEAEAQLASARSVRPAINRDGLRKSIRASSIGLEAVLTHVPLTVAACSRLKVGQVVELPDAEAGKLALHARTMTGSVEISQAELGNWKGQRAIKLTTPILENFIEEISGA